MTAPMCRTACAESGFEFAFVKEEKECYCGNGDDLGSHSTSDCDESDPAHMLYRLFPNVYTVQVAQTGGIWSVDDNTLRSKSEDKATATELSFFLNPDDNSYTIRIFSGTDAILYASSTDGPILAGDVEDAANARFYLSKDDTDKSYTMTVKE
eukprot:CAMPEP_0118719630 /NCGR_PEP_ID=MMETSP0800-20121206/29608_1 /TAXON_ID=210618 ORGANISM="Striatella unipunctata, Strain CCMP2910" /NCGR_SAMPLE_ID=MMETSP0800 /ASSEMBLY_ACC=CAM_ASM_000638 /LENGTH=152 /DNA_ID=CAMNT_0006627073 /DNA_START=348 /DNA_END=803 /DNA_ORIENTATION=+